MWEDCVFSPLSALCASGGGKPNTCRSCHHYYITCCCWRALCECSFSPAGECCYPHCPAEEWALKGISFAEGHSAHRRHWIPCDPEAGALSIPFSGLTHGAQLGTFYGSGSRVTSHSLLHPSGASKVTASGSHRSRLTARTEAGAPGPSSGRVHGPVGAGFDPVAGAVTIPRECTWLRGAGQGPEGLGGGGAGGQGPRKKVPCR